MVEESEAMKEMNRRVESPLTPTVGRMMHYRINGEACPAIVTKVWSPTCLNLVFWDANGVQGSMTSVVEGKNDQQWCWPPRV